MKIRRGKDKAKVVNMSPACEAGRHLQCNGRNCDCECHVT
jgi:hypothetical protein